MTPVIVSLSFWSLFGIVLAAFALGFKFLETTRQERLGILGDPVDRRSDPRAPRRPILISRAAHLWAAGSAGSEFRRSPPGGDNQAVLEHAGLPSWFQATAVLAVIGRSSGKCFPFLSFPLVDRRMLALPFGRRRCLYVRFKRRSRLKEFEERVAGRARLSGAVHARRACLFISAWT